MNNAFEFNYIIIMKLPATNLEYIELSEIKFLGWGMVGMISNDSITILGPYQPVLSELRELKNILSQKGNNFFFLFYRSQIWGVDGRRRNNIILLEIYFCNSFNNIIDVFISII